MPMAQATAVRAFGISYFDFGNTGHVKTATEVSFDNSALMRNIARHEHLLEGALVGLPHAPLHMSRSFGKQLADEDEARILFDDSIISDTAAEKAQDTAEANVTMHAREYLRVRAALPPSLERYHACAGISPEAVRRRREDSQGSGLRIGEG